MILYLFDEFFWNAGRGYQRSRTKNDASASASGANQMMPLATQWVSWWQLGEQIDLSARIRTVRCIGNGSCGIVSGDRGVRRGQNKILETRTIEIVRTVHRGTRWWTNRLGRDIFRFTETEGD